MPSTNIADVSGGIQSATNWKLRQAKEVEDAMNVRFGKKIGSAVRRDGHTLFKDTTGTTARGFFKAQFKEEEIWFLAGHNDAGTQTVVKAYRTLTDTFEDVITTLPINTNVQFYFHLNEVYMAGITDAGVRITPYNIRIVSGVLTPSTTRNLIGAPKAAYVSGRGGKLYLMNVEVNGVVYPDRIYESSPPMGAVTYIQATQTLYSSNGTTLNASDSDVTSGNLRLDSTRYVKAGMAVDIYAAGTSTKLYDWTILSVNNAKDTVTINPGTVNVGTVALSGSTVNTTTDVITVPTNSWMVTGTPITITSPTPPAPLVTGTTYYVINLTSTTIKLALTAANATAGTAIDLTTTGSGTAYFSARYTVSDNDEVWLDGRKTELSVLWNTDYRTEQTADYLQVPSGSAADTAVIGWYNSNNRLGVFTKTSTMDYDGANFKPVFEDIGAVSHNAIVNTLEWVIWVDSDANVHARDSTSGAHEVISRGMRNGFFDSIASADLSKITAGMVNGLLKINVGTVNGELTRYIYDFDLNNWSRDVYTRNLRFTINSRLSGKNRMYALTDTQTIYLEDEGNTDAGDVIPFMIQYGQRDYGVSFKKSLKGMFIGGSSVTGATVKVARPPKNVKTEWVDIGQLTDPISKLAVGDTKGMEDYNFNIRISHASEGEAQSIDFVDTHYEQQESTFGG